MKYKILMPLVIIALMFTSVLPGCNEELPPVEADELVMPSSMRSDKVFIEIASTDPPIENWPFFQGGWTANHIHPCSMPQGAFEEQFIDAFSAAFSELFYVKRNGERAGFRPYTIVSDITILKYEDTESAERSFINISETQGLQDSTYGGITLKNGTYTLTYCDDPTMWDEDSMACYLIHSGCFVIYIYGREDVAKDILDRIIVAFGVE